MSKTGQNYYEYSALISDKYRKLGFFRIKLSKYEIIVKDFRKILILFISYIVYLIFGALVFQLFEAPLEKTMRSQVTKMIDVFNDKLKTHNNQTITHDDIKDMLHKFLKARDMNLVDQYGNSTNHNWNFYNSFFFSITVVTTIGYGHLLPSTASGKIFCLFYALFGIPITGILLGAIGSLFSRCFMKRINNIRDKYDNNLNPRIILSYVEQGVIFFLPWFVVFMIIPSLLFVYIERWSFLEGFYYSFITLTTIGFGDYVAGNYDGAWVVLYKLMVVLWIIFGLSYLSMVLNFIGRGYKKVEHSEVMHSVGESMAHISEPFLGIHFHKAVNSDEVNYERQFSRTDGKYAVRRHSDGGSTPTDPQKTFDFCASSHSHSKASHSHHNHHKSNTSVIPYYP